MWSLQNAPSDIVRQPKGLVAPFARIRPYAPHALLTFAFGLSRLSCYLAGVRFDATTLPYYLQFVDPKLLKSSLGQSIFYLKEQPPAFNLFLGIVLKLVPGDPAPAFQIVYLLCGAVLALTLLSLLRRMGVSNWLSFAIALVFAINPVTILDENLLFYTYPLIALFCMAALFLHRFLTSRRTWDATGFFATLALIAASRAIFHFLWFVLIAGTLVWFVRSARRQLLVAMTLPGLLLLSIYLKNLLVFGSAIGGGEVFQAMNMARMATEYLPRPILPALVEQGKISRLLTRPFSVSRANASEFGKVVPPPPKTGISLLDEPFKSGGAMNLHALWMSDIARVYSRDARFVIGRYPGSYAYYVLMNVKRYFEPGYAGEEFANSLNEWVLREPLKFYEKIVLADTPFFLTAILLLCLGFGLFHSTLWTIHCLRTNMLVVDPRMMTVLFMVFNIVYSGVVTILLSWGDQNRYRTELSAFYAVLLGLSLGAAGRRLGLERIRHFVPAWILAARQPVFGAALLTSFVLFCPGIHARYLGSNRTDPDGASSKLTLSPASPLYNLEALQGAPLPEAGLPLEVSRFGSLVGAGWAVDGVGKGPAFGVDVAIDDRVYRAQAGLPRQDVADYFHVPGYANAGFLFSLPASVMGTGTHRLAIRVISQDGKTYTVGNPVTVAVR